jgi:hypothetical protein
MEYVTTRQVAPLYRATQVIWYLLDILEVILLFRFIMRLLGANPGAPFTQIIYSLSYPFVAPFQTVFSTTQIVGATFEWTTLIAMLVYWLIAWAIVRLFVMGKPVSADEADYGLRRQNVVRDDNDVVDDRRTVIVER